MWLKFLFGILIGRRSIKFKIQHHKNGEENKLEESIIMCTYVNDGRKQNACIHDNVRVTTAFFYPQNLFLELNVNLNNKY